MRIALCITVAGLAAAANADITYGVVDNPLFTPVAASAPDQSGIQTSDGYFLVPAIGAAGFAFAGSGFTNSVFDGAAEQVGVGLLNQAPIIGSDATLSGAVNALGNATFQIAVANGLNEDIWPSGFNVGGAPANRGGLFLGANAGGNPLDFTLPVIVNEVIIFGLDASGTQILGADVTAILTANNTDVDGFWNGSLGIGFGPGSAGLGIVTVGYQFDVTFVPTPSSAAVLGFGGLLAARRRR